MVDIISKNKRSEIMSSIRSKGNRTTELTFLTIIKTEKLSGWRRHDRSINGTPDFIFPKQKVAIFLDGCFWHRCKKCNKVPKTNRVFWQKKFKKNRKRDLATTKNLHEQGWKVIRYWEHNITKDSYGLLVPLRKLLKS